jgi:hypothetical protein
LAGAREVTLTKPAMLRGERSIVSLKAGTVVELVSRDEKTLTVRFNKVTGTIPVGSVDSVETPKAEASKPDAPPPPRKAETTYGKAVEKARENAARHEKNEVRPTDEILGK